MADKKPGKAAPEIKRGGQGNLGISQAKIEQPALRILVIQGKDLLLQKSC